MPIQLAQCWFPGLAISSAKIEIHVLNKITEAILSNRTRGRLWFEITKTLIAGLKNNFIALFIRAYNLPHFRSRPLPALAVQTVCQSQTK